MRDAEVEGMETKKKAAEREKWNDAAVYISFTKSRGKTRKANF